MTNDFYKTFEQIEDLLEEAMKLPLSKSKYIIDGAILRDLLDELKDNLPEEMKKSQEILENKEKMLDGAREESDMLKEQAKKLAEQVLVKAKKNADSIVDRAKAQAEAMVNEQEILIVAKERSKEIVETAKNDAIKLRTVAVNYLDDVLSSSEQNLRSALEAVEQAKKTYVPKQ